MYTNIFYNKTTIRIEYFNDYILFRVYVQNYQDHEFLHRITKKNINSLRKTKKNLRQFFIICTNSILILI